MNKAIVYWLHYKDHVDYFSEGYIGVTVNLPRRIKTHLREVKQKKHTNEALLENLTNEIIITVLFEGIEEDCYNFERECRPTAGIAWNVAPGGAKGGCRRSGYTLSEDFKDKRRSYMLGNTRASGGKGKPKSPEHRQKISQGNKGKIVSEEQKLKQSITMRGRTLSKEHKEKIRIAGLGKKRGPYKKKGSQNVVV